MWGLTHPPIMAPPSPPPGPSPLPPPIHTSGWKAAEAFAYLERTFPSELLHPFSPCAKHCATLPTSANALLASTENVAGDDEDRMIGTCVPHGFVLEGQGADAHESALSDRGQPYCGGGLCCRARDDTFTGDPNCFGQGCAGHHCCVDPAPSHVASAETDRDKITAAARAAGADLFAHRGASSACYITGLNFGEGSEVPSATESPPVTDGI